MACLTPQTELYFANKTAQYCCLRFTLDEAKRAALQYDEQGGSQHARCQTRRLVANASEVGIMMLKKPCPEFICHIRHFDSRFIFIHPLVKAGCCVKSPNRAILITSQHRQPTHGVQRLSIRHSCRQRGPKPPVFSKLPPYSRNSTWKCIIPSVHTMMTWGAHLQSPLALSLSLALRPATEPNRARLAGWTSTTSKACS